MIGRLLHLADQEPTRRALTFLVNGEVAQDTLTYGQLDTASRAIAAELQRRHLEGERVLLFFPPGLDFITAFLGCLYAGVIAVPAYPPRRQRVDQRLRSIVRDCRPKACLTIPSIHAFADRFQEQLPDLGRATWINLDDIDFEDSRIWSPPSLQQDSLAFLQYTSGSTANPKGVMISHGNLLANEAMIQRAFGQSEASLVVGWLPLYHDMGLIGNLLQPLYSGAQAVLMSPVDFLRRPIRWLRAISDFRATTSGGPNFAYDLCSDKISDEDRADLDLSTWQVAFSGAEPVRAATLERFASRFAPQGFRRRAFYPCYGLAEGTLLVSGADVDREPIEVEVEAASLDQHRVTVLDSDRGHTDARRLVGCGRPWNGQRIRIVDPETSRPLSERVGEIWVSGQSVAQGYWGQPELSAQMFRARIDHGDPVQTDATFLRTGDLGFLHEGELFITGRLKDLIILRGRNLYPQDIELTVESADQGLRPGCSAAFSIEVAGEERLAVVAELRRQHRSRSRQVIENVRRRVSDEHQVQIHALVLIREASILKTSSGKIRRRACRNAFLHGELKSLETSLFNGAATAAKESPSREELELDRATLAGLNAEARRAHLLAFLHRQAARSSGLAEANIDARTPLVQLGLDSLAAVELSQAVESALAIELQPAKLLDDASLDDLLADIEGRLDTVEAATRAEQSEEAASEIIARHEVGPDLFPLSEGQRGLWFVQGLPGAASAYNIAAGLRFATKLDPELLRRAVERLVTRHDALRSTFELIEDQPQRRLHRKPRIDFYADPAAAPSPGEIRPRMAAEARRPFDLATGPLVRARLWSTSEASFLLFVVHHIAVDFWSLETLFRELGQVLADADAALTPAPPSDDQVTWLRSRIAGQRGEALWNFWRRELDGAPTVLELPTDRPRPPLQSFRGQAVGLDLDDSLTRQAEAVGRSLSATTFTVLLSAFQALLARYSGQDTVLVGTPMSVGRSHAALSGVVGYGVRPVVLRADLATRMTFESLVHGSKSRLLKAVEHQDFPFRLLSERLDHERDPSRSPIFQAMFAWQRPRGQEGLIALAMGQGGVELRLGDLEAESVALPEHAALFDLNLRLGQLAGRWLASLQFNTDLFDATTAHRLLRHFRALLTAATENPAKPLLDLPFFDRAERFQMLGEWNATELSVRDRRLEDLVLEQVERSPEAVALRTADGDLASTYGELDRRSAAVAARLSALGCEAESRVGICLGRSLQLPTALLGVLRAGGAWVPLDPSYPEARLSFILDDSGCELVISERAWIGNLPLANRVALLLDDFDFGTGSDSLAMPQKKTESSNQLAYAIYTSGSTGRPKGVAIEHRSAVHLVEWSHGPWSDEDLATTFATTSINFDLSIFEIFVPLARGGTVVVGADALAMARARERSRISLLNSVPSAVAELLRHPGFRAPRVVNVAGEPLTAELVDRLHEAGAERVFNLYGPSEDTTYSTWERFQRLDGPTADPPPIGRPIAGTAVRLLDRRGRAVPVGVPGELFLTGLGLARGYLARPSLTAEHFVPDAFARAPGLRSYRTGDLARHRADGRLDFLGRIDHQVKIRGFRVELGEIESALERHPAVQETAVLALHGIAGPRLVAFLAASDDAPRRAFLEQRLPAFMVPERFVVLPALPRTPNGKIDRAALKSLERLATLDPTTPRQEASTPARTATEALLREVWRNVLEMAEEPASDTDFFAAGGHSLLAARLTSRVNALFDVELPFSTLFENPTPERLAARVDRERRGTRSPLPGLVSDRSIAETSNDAPPLTFAQERLWFLDRLEPGSPLYNLPTAMRLQGQLQPRQLETALCQIVERHQVLRHLFPEVDGQPQVVLSARPFALPLVDLSALDGPRRVFLTETLSRWEARRSFALDREAPFRALLLRLDEREHLALLSFHHIACDGGSFAVLSRELETAFRTASGLGAPVQYAEYARWQRRVLTPEVLAAPLAWWRERLRDRPTALELPFDRPPGRQRGRRGLQRRRVLPSDLAEGLQRLCASASVTPFMALLGIFETLLWRLSNQDRFLLGMPVSNRRAAATEELIGLFVNTLVLRAEVVAGRSLIEHLGQVREELLAALDHADLPFERLVDELEPEREWGRHPLFQVFFSQQNALPAPRLPGLDVEIFELDAGIAKFDLTLVVEEHRDGWALVCEANADLFEATTLERWLWQAQILLASAIERPTAELAVLALLTRAERHRLLIEANDTATPLQQGSTVLHRIRQTVAERPDAVAVVDGARHWTFGALDRHSEALAARLAAAGVVPGDRVAVRSERSAETLLAWLAIWKLDAAYLPLDPTFPEQRQAYMLADAGIRILLSTEPEAPVPGFVGRVLPLPIQTLLRQALPPKTPDRPVEAIRAFPRAPAYVIYTSGSTGRPKGVVIPHRALANHSLAVARQFELRPGERVLQFSALGFDVAAEEIFASWCQGCAVVLASNDATSPRALLEQLARDRIAVANLPGSYWQELVAELADEPWPAATRLLIAGSERISRPLLDLWRRRVGDNVRWMNAYGLTETTITATLSRGDGAWRAHASASVPIGRPIANLVAHVLDPRGGITEPLPVGVLGELHIGGDGLAQGYLERPRRSAERFLPDPHAERPGQRLYRTGDLARRLPEGSIEILGRLDRQIKIRGHRVEPGEVEAKLGQLPGIAQAAVMLAEGGVHRGGRLVAFLVSADAGEILDTDALRRQLRGELPAAMLPDVWLQIDAMPRTASGKLDRRALAVRAVESLHQGVGSRSAQGDSDSATKRKSQTHLSPLEEVLADVWSGLLGVEIGPDDNFFTLGGHSLLAVQMLARVRRALGVELPVRHLFEAPTLAAFASLIEGELQGEPLPSAPPLRRRRDDGEPRLSFAQERLWFLHQLQPEDPTYSIVAAVDLHGSLNVAALEASFQALEERHETLRTTFPESDGHPRQTISTALDRPLPRVSLDRLPRDVAETAWVTLGQTFARRPFDVARGPLWRLALVRLSDDEHRLVLAFHHLISDGWSFDVLLADLQLAYAALTHKRPLKLSPLSVQYADWAAWQRRWLTPEILAPGLDWWAAQLRGAPTHLDLPADRPRPPRNAPSSRGKRLSFRLSAALTQALEATSRKYDATLFMTLLTAFKILLLRLGGGPDLVVGTPVAQRNRDDIEGLIGCFVNTLALRTDLSLNPPFEEALARVRSTSLAALAQAQIPFERVVNALASERYLSQSPLFQVFFVLQKNASTRLELPGLTLERRALGNGLANFDLSLSFEPRDSASGPALAGELAYRADLFDATTVARFGGYLERLLTAIVATPRECLGALDLFSPGERAALAIEWNDTARQPSLATFPELFERAVEHHGAVEAVVFGPLDDGGDEDDVAGDDRTLSYAELDRQVERLAARLASLGLGCEDLVVICLEREIAALVALLAVWRAGAAYLPLDPTDPPERRAFLLQDAEPAALITRGNLLGIEPPADLPIFDLAKIDLKGAEPAVPPRSSASRWPTARREQLAYILYTSGSTGRPKGVMVNHGCLVDYLLWVKSLLDELGIRHLPTISRLGFDASFKQLLAPLLDGGRVWLTPPELLTRPARLLAALNRQPDAALNGVPSLWRSLLAEIVRGEAEPPAWRALLLGGEPIPRQLLEQTRDVAPGLAVINLYGPTEATANATWARLRPETPVTLGRPLDGRAIAIVDRRLERQPIGVAGELVIASGLARGYWRRAALTAERFVPNPFGERDGQRLYRSGDLARVRANGELEFLGRIDRQVKVRGFRIELGEIDAALNGHAALREATVVRRGAVDEAGQLIAFVVARQPSLPDLSRRLNADLGARLPDFMVPTLFVELDALPRLPGGKIDHRALLDLDIERPETPPGKAGEATPTEEILRGLWCEVLDVDTPRLDDNFFALGGHSLLATRVLSRIRRSFNVELPLRTLFEQPTIRSLARVLAEARSDAAQAAPPIHALSASQRSLDLPLSFSQQRLWFLEQMDPGKATYVIAAALDLRGALRIDALRMALDRLVRRHEALRTRFAERVGSAEGPVQVIDPLTESTLEWCLIDLGAEAERSRTAAEQRVETLSLELARQPCDLAGETLFRAHLLRLFDQHHRLVLTLHHIVADAWSTGVLVPELHELYAAVVEGRSPGLAEPALQPADFAVWQRRWLAGKRLERLLDRWREHLDGAPQTLDLPTDRPRPKRRRGRGASLPVSLPDGLETAVQELARDSGSTSFMVLLAAFGALLRRHTGQTDLLLGTPVANRHRIEFERLVGFLVNTLVLRLDLAGDPTFRQLVDRVRDETLWAWAHQDVPFEQLVQRLEHRRDLGRTPLFQVILGWNETTSSPTEAAGDLDWQFRDLDTGTAKFDWTLMMHRGQRSGARSLGGLWEYDVDLFDRSTITRARDHLLQLLGSAVAAPETRLSELSLLSAAEQQQLREWNDRQADFPRQASIPELFAEQVKHGAERIAVSAAGEDLSYATLDALSSRLAVCLHESRVRRGTRVGICLERSVEWIAALLAVLRAGGVYVPLDPGYPRERLAWMMDDSGTRILIADPALIAGQRPESGLRLDFDRQTAARLLTTSPAGTAAPELDANQLAYVIYTSGSTGLPKGVGVPHRAVVRLVKGTDYVDFRSDDSLAQVSNASFDAATFEIWGALLNGARLVILSLETSLNFHRFPRELGRGRISTLFLTTALFQQLAHDDPNAFAPLRQLLVGGEALDPKRAADVLAARAPERLMNVYGPTENTTYSTWHSIHQVATGASSVPIGRLIANSIGWVVDRQLRLVAVGVEGELVLGGDGLAHGYQGRPSLTAERFVPNPFVTRSPGERLYRTGDRVRLLTSGTIDFVGRVDHQVKLRGFRVEPGEVQAALITHPDVHHGAVVVRQDRAHQKRLVAYAVPRPESRLRSPELLEFMRRRLPEHMIPSAFVILEELPLNPNGKVDRDALPEPAPSASEAAENRDPQPSESFDATATSPVAELLRGIWCEVLGVEAVAPEADFFELGGHSLMAAQLISRVRHSLAVELPLRDLFDAPTLAAFTARVEVARHVDATPIAPLARQSRDRPLRLSFAQERLWFLARLVRGPALYTIPLALDLRGEVDFAALDAALRQIENRHEVLRARIGSVDGEPVQIVDGATKRRLRVVDLGALAPVSFEQTRERLLRAASRRPFELEHGPLWRTLWLRGRGPSTLLVHFHHIIADGWSLEVFARELAELYGAARQATGGDASTLPELPFQPADVAAWQRAQLNGEVLTRDLDFWRQTLAAAPQVLELPTDRPRPAVRRMRGGSVSFTWPGPLVDALHGFARRHDLTFFMTLLAGFKSLLYRYSGQRICVVGTPVANREPLETEAMIGLFVNTLALASPLDGWAGFAAQAARIREVVLEARAHQSLPFEKLVEELQPSRDLAHAPIFQVFFSLNNLPLSALRLPGLDVNPRILNTQTSPFDLTLALMETGGSGDEPGPGEPSRLDGALDFNRGLFDPTTIARMTAQLRVLLAAAIEAPETPLDALPLLTPAAGWQITAEWNDTAANTTASNAIKTDVLLRLAERVHEQGDDLALICGDERWTYHELDRRASDLAARLRAGGVGRETLVALLIERSAFMLQAVLAVLKAGGTYIPLDPGHPRERLRQILADTGRPLLLADREIEQDLAEMAGRILRPGGETDSLAAPIPAPRPKDVERFPSGQLAYVIFTSGSTGHPKGVQVTRGGLANFLASMADRPGLDCDDTLVAVTTLAFDIAGLELLLPLMVGARVVLARRHETASARALEQLLAHHRATAMQATPATWRMLLDAGWRPPAGFKILCGGEALDGPLAARLLVGDGELWNLYGPTETTIWSAVERVALPPSGPPATAALGRPIANTQLLVLDRNGRVVPPGVPGELLIGGAGLARGYFDRPGLSAERFVPDACSPVAGGRLYRTGDLARALADGRLEFLGRLDHQVKIRGFRIELGEIEVALGHLTAVRQAVVVARPEPAEPSRSRLVGYAVAEPGREPKISDLRADLARTLPDYMVPTAWVFLNAFPLNPSGKVDRRALPEPSGERAMQAAPFTPPSSDLERRLGEIWRRRLGASKVSIDDNFFDLGGHSLLLAGVHDELRALGFDVTLLDLFEQPTIRALARKLADDKPAQSEIGDERAELLERGKDRLRRNRERRRREAVEV